MKFALIDKIYEVDPGRKIRGSKSLSLAEEYLADHFPAFPVLPGVLMLQAMVELSSWLVRITQDFANSVVLLKEARNVSYGSFVLPGERIEVVSEAMKIEDKESSFKASCLLNNEPIVKARLILQHYNLAERYSGWDDQDKLLTEHLRRHLALLLSSTET